jgi:cardiolipin synthase
MRKSALARLGSFLYDDEQQLPAGSYSFFAFHWRPIHVFPTKSQAGDATTNSRRRALARIISAMKDKASFLDPLRTAPNLLTLLRICMAPFLVAAILQSHYALGFWLFVAAGLTDAMDGLLARALHQRSVLGHYLDPVADKLLLSTLFLVLLHKGLMPVTVTVLVFGRDVGILLVAAILYAAVGRREFLPSIFGKANTLAQISAVAAVLLYQLMSVVWVDDLRRFALAATMALTVASGLHYAWMVSRRSSAPAVNGAASRPAGQDPSA